MWSHAKIEKIMKDTVLISLLLWIMATNIGKIWPISYGERYFQNLQKWYLLANKGEWDKAKEIEKYLKTADIENFSKKNKADELTKRLSEINMRGQKNADDWMEIAVLLNKLNKKDEAYVAIENAYKLDPIREDISSIYFTYRTSLQHSPLP